jgi:actin related protein 2/3 complex, subunit 4
MTCTNSSREDYLAQVSRTLYSNLCLRDFPCQEVERHSKPEVESSSCSELVLQPVTIDCLASREKCLIEPSINATRVSFMFRTACETEGLQALLSESYFRFLGVKADQLPLLRRAAVDGFDVSFLVTASLLQQYGVMYIIMSLVKFAQQTPEFLHSLKQRTDQQNQAMAKSNLRVFGKREISTG